MVFHYYFHAFWGLLDNFLNNKCYMMTVFQKSIVPVLFLFLLSSCSSIEDIPVITNETVKIPATTNGTDLLKFSLIARNGTTFSPFLINDTAVYVCVTNQIDLSQARMHISHNGLKAYVNDREFVDEETFDLSDFTNPHHLKIKSSLTL